MIQPRTCSAHAVKSSTWLKIACFSEIQLLCWRFETTRRACYRLFHPYSSHSYLKRYIGKLQLWYQAFPTTFRSRRADVLPTRGIFKGKWVLSDRIWVKTGHISGLERPPMVHQASDEGVRGRIWKISSWVIHRDTYMWCPLTGVPARGDLVFIYSHRRH